MEEVAQEMTLDEWKNLQQQNRPKPEFNIRKPESTVPSKAVVIHKSKYRDDVSIALGVSKFYFHPGLGHCLGPTLKLALNKLKICVHILSCFNHVCKKTVRFIFSSLQASLLHYEHGTLDMSRSA